MTRTVGIWLAGTCMLLILSACSESPRSDSLTALRDQAIALEQDHYDRALRLDTPLAIREETAQYAQAIHRILEDMEDACLAMHHGDVMMGGHSEEHMLAVMREMHASVEEHHRHIDAMVDLEAMWEECEQHHHHMGAEMADLDASLGGGSGMHRGH